MLETIGTLYKSAPGFQLKKWENLTALLELGGESKYFIILIIWAKPFFFVFKKKIRKRSGFTFQVLFFKKSISRKYMGFYGRLRFPRTTNFFKRKTFLSNPLHRKLSNDLKIAF
ncbi:hypothetical protein [Aureivirga sp. CE67]|uniref:hypothetical protein n=1 Tax=Aureivirga sp. CE67 TaxID=1788983 RepID=UPI0018C8E816|nr:hypothetical protein [Aureivirga sp. CE67]